MEAIYTIAPIEVLVLIMGIFLLCGKGAGLIAGYNTASEKEKKKYNEKKLCRTMGIFCMGLFLWLGAVMFLTYRVEKDIMTENAMLPYLLSLLAILFIGVGFVLWYSNKKCLK